MSIVMHPEFRKAALSAAKTHAPREILGLAVSGYIGGHHHLLDFIPTHIGSRRRVRTGFFGRPLMKHAIRRIAEKSGIAHKNIEFYPVHSHSTNIYYSKGDLKTALTEYCTRFPLSSYLSLLDAIASCGVPIDSLLPNRGTQKKYTNRKMFIILNPKASKDEKGFGLYSFKLPEGCEYFRTRSGKFWTRSGWKRPLGFGKVYDLSYKDVGDFEGISEGDRQRIQKFKKYMQIFKRTRPPKITRWPV